MLTHGTIVGDGEYRIERPVGRGGMAEVYVATELALERVVALKLLAPELSNQESLRKRFRREGRMQASLEHPHIVPVYAAGTWDDTAFIAMKLIRGADLKALIVGRRLEPAASLRIMSAVADALDFAHVHGLVHRDVKPQNILVEETGHAYLADFGLTRSSASEISRLTKTGQLLGSIDYMAPEHIQGEEPSPAGDVYALACTVFECLAGSVPFIKPTPAAVLFAHISDAPPSPSKRRPGLPAAVDDVIARGMAKDPADRPSSARVLMAEIASALGGEVWTAATAPPRVAFPEEAGLRGGAVGGGAAG